MNKRPYRDILDTAAADSLSRSADLWPKIEANLERKSLMLMLRSRPLVAMLIALFILLTLSGVVYALGRALGYIPGVGIVDQSVPLRVLAEPASVTQDGVTVTVYKGFSDAGQTQVVMRVEIVNKAQMGPGTVSDCGDGSGLLRLPDGSTLPGLQEAGSNAAYWMEFPPMPADVTNVVLHIQCLVPFSPDMKMPGNWDIPLIFRQADKDEAVPVLEVPTFTPLPSPATTIDAPAASKNALSIKLENVVELDDGYILMGRMYWDATQNLYGGVFWADDNVSVLDANGNAVVFQSVMDDPSYWNIDLENMTKLWAYQINGKDHAWPVTLSIRPPVTLPANISFSMDFGTDPQPGQTWNVNKEFEIGPHVLRVLNARLEKNDNIYQLSFDMSSDTIQGAMPYIENFTMDGGGGSGGGGGLYEFEGGVSYEGSFPITGRQVAVIDFITVLSDTLLQVQWQP